MQKSEICLGPVKHLWQSFSVKMLILNWQGLQYASEGIFPLSIYLGDHFEFRISHFSGTYVYGYPKMYLGSYRTSMMEFLPVFPFYLLITTAYLVVTSGNLIAATGYFWLLLVTSCYFWFLVLVTAMIYSKSSKKCCYCHTNLPQAFNSWSFNYMWINFQGFIKHISGCWSFYYLFFIFHLTTTL